MQYSKVPREELLVAVVLLLPLVLFLEDPNALKRSHEGDFDRLSGVWHLLGKEVATVPEEYAPLQAPNDGFT